MEDFKERLLYLLHYPHVTWNSVNRLLKEDPSLSSVYHLHPNELHQTPPVPPLNSFRSHPQEDPSNFIHEQMRQYERDEIQVISYFDDEYPPLLKEIYQPPWALFAKGDITLLKKELKLAVVGTRQPTQYGEKSIRMLFPKLLAKEIVIVSGLAKGIDTLAHEWALNLKGKTIAVIAGGLYHVYPKENKRLAHEMMNNQLVLSEYPPNTKPEKWHFPVRNRIISGLSIGTLIIEAKQKSGSLITANYAVNEGREVFSLPGNIFNPNSIGTNELIQQGAKLVTSAEDILEEIRI